MTMTPAIKAIAATLILRAALYIASRDLYRPASAESTKRIGEIDEDITDAEFDAQCNVIETELDIDNLTSAFHDSRNALMDSYGELLKLSGMSAADISIVRRNAMRKAGFVDRVATKVAVDLARTTA